MVRKGNGERKMLSFFSRSWSCALIVVCVHCHACSLSCTDADSGNVALVQLLVLVRDQRRGLSALTLDVDNECRLMLSFVVWLPRRCGRCGTCCGLVHMWHGCILEG